MLIREITQADALDIAKPVAQGAGIYAGGRVAAKTVDQLKPEVARSIRGMLPEFVKGLFGRDRIVGSVLLFAFGIMTWEEVKKQWANNDFLGVALEVGLFLVGKWYTILAAIVWQLARMNYANLWIQHPEWADVWAEDDKACAGDLKGKTMEAQFAENRQVATARLNYTAKFLMGMIKDTLKEYASQHQAPKPANSNAMGDTY